jgi:catechol 2,3-dioxygenase-like lactoylglutathione lyase family enzyme
VTPDRPFKCQTAPYEPMIGRAATRRLREQLNVLESSQLQTIVWTSRVDESARFYEQVLGLRCKTVCHGARVYDVGNAELRLSPVPSTQPSAHTVVGFAVADVGSVTAYLAARGVTFERFPGFSHDALGIAALPDGTRVAWFRDPDGNLLSVVQYP